jgi:hypothetical protein
MFIHCLVSSDHLSFFSASLNINMSTNKAIIPFSKYLTRTQVLLCSTRFFFIYFSWPCNFYFNLVRLRCDRPFILLGTKMFSGQVAGLPLTKSDSGLLDWLPVWFHFRQVCRWRPLIKVTGVVAFIRSPGKGPFIVIIHRASICSDCLTISHVWIHCVQRQQEHLFTGCDSSSLTTVLQRVRLRFIQVQLTLVVVRTKCWPNPIRRCYFVLVEILPYW